MNKLFKGPKLDEWPDRIGSDFAGVSVYLELDWDEVINQYCNLTIAELSEIVSGATDMDDIGDIEIDLITLMENRVKGSGLDGYLTIEQAQRAITVLEAYASHIKRLFIDGPDAKTDAEYKASIDEILAED